MTNTSSSLIELHLEDCYDPFTILDSTFQYIHVPISVCVVYTQTCIHLNPPADHAIVVTASYPLFTQSLIQELELVQIRSCDGRPLIV